MQTENIKNIESVEREEKINLKEFLRLFGDTLKKKAIQSLKPIYNPAKLGEWEKSKNLELNNLKRNPFNSQRHAILALSKGFYKEDRKSLILTAEMGTGKTLMSICVAYLNPRKNKRVLVICPPHLSKKWVREINETIPDANVRIIQKTSDITREKPKGMEFWILKNTSAKLHYKEKFIPLLDKNGNINKCPECGKPLMNEEIKEEFLRKCPHCKTGLYYADNSGLHRYAISEYIKRKRVKVDFLIIDEVHELKGGDTSVGQAMANLVSCADKTLAMTGTLMGGYAKNLFYILFRMFSKKFIEKQYTHNSVFAFERDYGIIKVKKVRYSNNNRVYSIGGRQKTVSIVSKPGMSPALLPEFILDSTYFMKLSDVSDKLPAYEEDIILVDMGKEQKEKYKDFETKLVNEVKSALSRGSQRLLGSLINSLYALPDGARKGEKVYDPEYKVSIAEALPVADYFLPKEQKLLEKILEEKLEGRKCAIFLEHTGTRDLIPDIVERLENNGIKTLVLKTGSPETDQRENWINKKMKENPDIDVLICNPNLVKTGLDLLDFPTIIFFQTGYNIYTMRQASRRSWRIGQEKPVKVYFMAYLDTMQERALRLMASKLETSLAVEGDLSDQGLSSMSEGESLSIQLAKELIGQDVESRSLADVFSSYREKDVLANIDLDESYEVVNLIETEQTVKTIKTSKGKSQTIGTSITKIINSIEPKKHTVKKGKKKVEVNMVSIFDIIEALESSELAV